MHKLVCDMSLDKTTITSDNLHVTISQMAQTFLVECSWVPNGFLFSLLIMYTKSTFEWGFSAITKIHSAVNY